MPTARRCQGCGATLREGQEGEAVITCPFCGLAYDVDAGPPGGAPVVVRVENAGVGRAARRIILIVFAIVVLAFASSAAEFIWLSTHIPTTVIDHVSTMTPARGRDASAALAPADLASITAGGGWRRLEIAPPPGGFDAFDPVGGIPWAMAIGRAWAADAVITRVDVGRVSATGVVDLSGEQVSGYRFVSPARQSQRKNEIDTGTKSSTSSELMVQLKGTEVRALATDSPTPPAPVAASSLGLDRILDGARHGRGFVERPFYSGYLIHLPREGWCWYFQTPSGESLPRIRARDGKSYPY